MATPYWGHLPKTRRTADDIDDRRGSLDGGTAYAAPSADKRANRASVQTTRSDAPTNSTLSPYASPVASSFTGAGLAPRPPSLPYGANQYPPEAVYDKRRRRTSRNSEQEAQEDFDAPPAAPEVPSAPPVSYKYPAGAGGLPYTYTTSGARPPGIIPHPRRPEAAYGAPEMDPEDFYRAAPSQQPSQSVRNAQMAQDREFEGALPVKRVRRSSLSDGRPNQPQAAEPNGYRDLSEPLPQDRRFPLAPSGSTRRKVTATDERSPLQQLEAKLKEEKRARVVEAERIAKERAAEKQSQRVPAAKEEAVGPSKAAPQVRFSNRDPSEELAAANAIDERQRFSLHRSPLTQNPVDQTQRYGSVSSHSRQASTSSGEGGNGYVPASPRGADIPQRNLSFKERAARDHIKLPNGVRDESSIAKTQEPVRSPSNGGGLSLTRSGSNKLKKNPPGDPWYSRRAEAEQKYNSIQPRNPDAVPEAKSRPVPGAAATASAGPTVRAVPVEEPPARKGSLREGSGLAPPAPIVANSNTTTRNGRPAELGDVLIPAGSRPAGSTSVPRQHHHHAIEPPAPIGPAKRQEQQPPPHHSESIKRRAEEGIAAAATAAGATGVAGRMNAHLKEHEHDDDDESTGSEDSHHWTKQNYQPGSGMYKPPVWLEEWRKAPVGTLSGPLLDLDEEAMPTVPSEKDKTWWETPSKRIGSGGSTISSRPRKAEAFDGEYDDTSGEYTQLHPRLEMLRTRKAERHDVCGPSMAGGTFQASDEDEDAKVSGPRYIRPSPLFAASRTHPLTRTPFARAIPGGTRFKPQLHLKCGPLLRFCGIKAPRVPGKAGRNSRDQARDKEIWRGTVMIVTQDSQSSYDIAPTLRLFAQPIELLPPPPHEIHEEELAPEYIDPIVGHPKLGRKGETLYTRPVEHLEEAKDLSRDETDSGLFEATRSPPDDPLPKGETELPGSFAGRKKRSAMDGEKAGKYKDVRGFRLHRERGCTFWRFNVEVELRRTQQRIAYRINRGPAMGFWVPAKGQSMNVMFHTCNGFSLSVDPDHFSGPDPMWRDVLNTHQSAPFHVMIGGGDQIYNDAAMRETRLFREWLTIRNPLHKHNAPFSPAMQEELEHFFFERYCMWFSQGLFGLANSQIPMVNMYDDHDIIDGFGSYPHHFMTSPVFSGLGNIAFKYYMLFQHQSVVGETEANEPSWLLGANPGPYIHERSRSLLMSLGGDMALLAVDCRTERTREEVVREDTWKKIMDRCYAELVKGKTQHLLVLLGIPIAYPRLVWLENILTSRIMDPVKALAKTGIFGNVTNKFDGGVEVLDDLDDHWTAKNHKHERGIIVEDLQDLAAGLSVRVTILSGDVHLAAVGQFYSNPKLRIPKHKDFRYMPNIISSAIVNTPPPDLMADVLNKRNKVHHFDKETDEDMIPLFEHGVDGKPRKNKRLLPHRNWVSIREWHPGQTPPPTPPPEEHAFDETPMGSPPGRAVSNGGAGGLLRRLSRRKAPGPALRPDAPGEYYSRPPLSASRFFRPFTRRRASYGTDGPLDDDYEESPAPQPGFRRTLSLGRDDFRPGNIFRRFSSSRKTQRPDDGGINGNWGESDEDDDYYDRIAGVGRPGPPPGQRHELPAPGGAGSRARGAPPAIGLGLRGGAGSLSEFEEGDDSYFTTRAPQRSSSKAQRLLGAAPDTIGPGPGSGPGPGPGAVPQSVAPQSSAPLTRPFHRTPTGLSLKQARKHGAHNYEVDLEGGLDIRFNVEVNQRDPAGITVPYRLIVPRLWHEDVHDDDGDSSEGDDGVDGRVEGKRAEMAGDVNRVGGQRAAELEGGYVERRPSAIRRLFSLRRGGQAQGQQRAELPA
jgi:hypothetical protein